MDNKFSRCSVSEEVDLMCKDAAENKYVYPVTDENMVEEWRRLRLSGRSHSSSYSCFNRYVPWLKVTVFEVEGPVTRCAHRFGTRLNSEETSFEEAEVVLKGYEVGTKAKFWEQIEDEDHCVLGFDDPNKLGDAQDIREVRDALWTGWLICAMSSLIVTLCTLFMPDEEQQSVDTIVRVE